MADPLATIKELRTRIADLQHRHQQQSRRITSLEKHGPHRPPAPARINSASGVDRTSKTQNRKSKTPPGGPGTELFAFYKSLGVTGCGACNRLRRQMDQWGVAGCREPENMEHALNDLMRRAPHWWKTQKPWVKSRLWWHGNESLLDALRVAGKAVTNDVRAALRAQLEIHVQMAIESAAAKGFA